MENTPIEMSGAQALREGSEFIKRFCVLPSARYADLTAVWAMGTHAFKAFDFYPRAGVVSLKPASGKSRWLRLTGLLCNNPKTMTSYTDAALGRWMTKGRTLLLDETDTVFRTTSSAPKMQALLNDGAQREGTQDKCAGSNEVEERSIYCPVAFAGLRELPRATATRTLWWTMEPRKPEQRIERFISRTHVPAGMAIGEAMGSWVKANIMELAEAWPDLPDGMEDRVADCWSPILAIADVAGEEWPDLMREAYDTLSKGVEAEPQMSPLVRLLADIQAVWTGDRLPSSVLCGRLMSMKDAPWSARWEPARAASELAAMLRQADIAPRKMRIDGKRPVQGYDKADFVKVWNLPEQAEQPEHAR
jgi:hypothetical protein